MIKRAGLGKYTCPLKDWIRVLSPGITVHFAPSRFFSDSLPDALKMQPHCLWYLTVWFCGDLGDEEGLRQELLFCQGAEVHKSDLQR